MCSTSLGHGWNISPEGFKLISENNTITDRNILLRNSLNADLKDIASPVLKTELSKNQINELVLQIQKIRNISAPKANEDSQSAPRMLKLILTDGENYAPAIEFSNISSISRERTPPGTKILLNKVKILNGFLILNPDNTKLLGGTVAHLFDKWELAKSVQHNRRPTVVSDGPPSWVDFGCEILSSVDETKETTNKSKDPPKDSLEFEVLRQGAIAEATTGAVRKVFGGCAKKFVPDDHKIEHNKVKYDMGRGYSKNKKEVRSTKEDTEGKLQKPSDKVSLFDFLENKLNITETISDNQLKSIELNKEYNSRLTQDLKKNTYKTYPNKKGSFQKSDYYNYSERNYDSHRDSRKDYTPKYETIKNHHYNSNSGESIKDKNKNFYMGERDSNKYIQKDLPLQKGIHSEHFNETHEYNTNKYGSIKEHHFMKDSNSTGKNVNIKEDNFAYSKRTYPKIENNESHNQFSRNSRFAGNEEKKINDSWHYRAPEKFNNMNQSMDMQVDNVSESLNKMSMSSNFASRTLRQHLNLNAKNPSTPQKISSHNDENGDHKEWVIGNECLAKYWEDEKFYPAKITASTATTFVVQFKGYGNIEEILKTDCMSLRRREKWDDKRQHKGTLEFRRNPEKPRPQ
ncbi:hypothetical protein WA026_020791 [Henosepilachna vigintioctopunctata]|uniref:Survival of motor neuron-related-splicing factor 30 n=1 Tax=Henosepilachna vigintioctopunctata TaxID=420089 RepID=A0AAW1U117_9CUCU